MNLILKNLSTEAQALFQAAIDEVKALGHDFEALFEHEETPAPTPTPVPDSGGGPGSDDPPQH